MTTPQPPAHSPGSPQPSAAPPPPGARQDTPTAVFSTQQLAPQAPGQAPGQPAAPPGPQGQPGQPGPEGGQPGQPGQVPAGAPAMPQGQQGQPGQQGQQPGKGGATYSSPIPVKQTSLGHAIASEWTKIRSVRSTMWTLGVMFVMTLGIGTLASWGLSTDDHAQVPPLSPGFFGLLLGNLCVVTLGVLVITSEYSTGMIRTTLTACPRRGRVLTAKIIVFFLTAFLTTLVATSLTALLSSSMLDGKPIGDSNLDFFDPDAIVDGEVVATSGEWLDATVGISLFMAVLGLLALAVGTLLRSSPGAVTTMIGVVLLPWVVSLFMWAEAVRDLGDKLREYSVINGISSFYRLSMAADADGSDTGWPLLGWLTAVTVAVLIGAYAKISTRDV